MSSKSQSSTSGALLNATGAVIGFEVVACRAGADPDPQAARSRVAVVIKTVLCIGTLTHAGEQYGGEVRESLVESFVVALARQDFIHHVDHLIDDRIGRWW